MSRDTKSVKTKDREINDDLAKLAIEVSNPTDYRPPVRVPPNDPDPTEDAPTKQAPGADR